VPGARGEGWGEGKFQISLVRFFKNDRLSLVAVFNEVLFLANEGKVCLRQMEGDVEVSMIV